MATEPTRAMVEHMKTYTQYLRVCVGWTSEECRELADEYRDVMQSSEGYKTVEAHLASVAPMAQATLSERYRRAA